MVICNMSIESGAGAGLVAVDDTSFEYVRGRPYTPKGGLWEQAVAAWADPRSDEDASVTEGQRVASEQR